MAQIFVGKFGKAFSCVAIAIYLMGVCISKCISTSNILKQTFTNNGDIPVLNNYYFWLTLFFTISAIFSFSNIQKTALL